MPSGACCMACPNNKRNNPKLSFFKLPKKMEIALKWIEFSGREDLDLSRTYTMCSEHFSPEQIMRDYPSLLLHPGSVPFLKGPRAEEGVATNKIIFESAAFSSGDIEKNTPHIQETQPCRQSSFKILSSDAAPKLGNADVASNTDYIPLTNPVKDVLRKVQKGPIGRGKNKKQTINSLRCKLYRKKVPQCFCKGSPNIPSKKSTINRLIKESKSCLSKESHVLFVNELKCSYIQKNNRRYDDRLREMCLLWYYASPKGYKAISKCLNLPTPRTLRNWQSKLKLSPGINPAVIESLKLHFSKSTEQNKEICSLMFDEISLSEELHFDQSSGKVVGVIDTGM